MIQKANSNIKSHSLAILACLLWSSAFVSTKYALEHQAPLTLAGLRFLLAGALQIPLCGSFLAPFRLIRTHFSTVFKISFFHTIYLYGTFFFAMQWVRGADAAILIGFGPLASALMAHLLMPNDKLQKRTLISIAFGMAGVIFISVSSKPWTPIGLKEFAGLMLLLSGTFVSSYGNITVAKLKSGLNPIVLNSAQMLLGGLVLLLLSLPFNGLPQLHQPPKFYILLLWLSIISAGGFAIWFHLLGHMKVSKLSLWTFLIPLSGATLSWLFIPTESPTLPAVAGMLFILAGLAIGTLQKTKPALPSNPKQI